MSSSAVRKVCGRLQRCPIRTSGHQRAEPYLLRVSLQHRPLSLCQYAYAALLMRTIGKISSPDPTLMDTCLSLLCAQVALAHALWGFPPHPDSLPAAGQAPDSWKRGFFSQPGAGLLYGGLFSSSRAGRDLALREAPTATWRLDCTAPRSKQALTQQLAGAKQCLALRGAGRRTCVVLTCGRDAATDAALGALADTGADMWSGVTDLTITAGTGDHPSTTIATPTTAGFVCSTVPALYANIRHLTLINCSCKLPTPSELPLLESVVITWLMRVHHYHVRGPTEQDENAMLASLGPFLPQLSSVHVEVVAGRSLQPMFTATSHKLRNFTTSEELTDQLLTALRTHTPALTHLSVEYIAGNISDHSSEHWAVEQLNVQVLCSSDRSIGSIEVLARLPQSTAGGRVGVSSQLGWGELSLTEQVRVSCNKQQTAV